ncbi:MAG: tetratricopeptide repeat protein [Candidatus Sumerlaeota bacterium]|nr:tetratricopeptide repeat protein [Candidatus Sumerlaeota bacterium]
MPKKLSWVLWICCGLAWALAPNARGMDVDADVANANKYSVMLAKAQQLAYPQKKFDQAIALLRQAAMLAPARPEAYLQIARIYDGRDRVDEARVAVVEAFTVRPTTDTGEMLLDHSRRLYRKQRYEEALNLVAPFYRWSPGYWGVIYQRLLCLNAMGRYEDTIKDGESAITSLVSWSRAHPDKEISWVDIVSQVGRAFYERGALKDVIQQFETSQAGQPPTSGTVTIQRLYLSEMGKGRQRDQKWDECIEYFKRAARLAPSNADYQLQVSRAYQAADRKQQAIEYLRETSKQACKDERLREELADVLFNESRFAEAEQIYRELYGENSKDRRRFDQIVACLVKQEKFSDAAAMIQAAILRIELSRMSDREKQRAIASLEEKHLGVLENSDLLDQRIRALARDVADTPTDTLNLNRLADHYAQNGQSELALSVYLMAATISGSPAKILEQTRKLMNAERRYEAIPYQEAMMEHFPASAEVFWMLDSYIYIKVPVQARRFAFSPSLADAYRRTELFCHRMANDDRVTTDLRARAELKELQYHLEPLASNVELWQSARTRALTLSQQAGMRDDVRRLILSWVADISLTRLDEPETAYRYYESLMREAPSRDGLQRLYETAMRINPMPPPATARQIIEERKDLAGDSATQLDLARWEWDAGERDQAIERIRVILKSRPKEPSKVLRILQRMRPDLARQLAGSKSSKPPSDVIEVKIEKIWDCLAPDLLIGDSAVYSEKTRLIVPSIFVSSAPLRLVTDDRPAVSDPPALFTKTSAAAKPASGATTETRTASPANVAASDLWAASWRPGVFSDMDPDAPVNLLLTSERKRTPESNLEARRSLVREKEDSDGYIFNMFIHSTHPFTVSFDMSEMRSGYQVLSPAKGFREDSGKISFDNDGEKFSAKEGTTFTIRLIFHKREGGIRRSRRQQCPSAEIVVNETKTTGTLQSEGDVYVLADDTHGLRLEVDRESDLPGAEPPHYAAVDRMVYRMGGVELAILTGK